MFWLILLLVGMFQEARAVECGDPDKHIRQGTDNVLDFWLAESEKDLQLALDAIGCSPVVSSNTLARFWLAEGIRLYYGGDMEGAQRALATARAADSAEWVTHRELEPALRDAYEAAPLLAGNPGRLALKGVPEDWQVVVDGAPLSSPYSVDPGWHLVQVGLFTPAASAARLVYVEPGVSVTVQVEASPAPQTDTKPELDVEPAETADSTTARQQEVEERRAALLKLASSEWGDIVVRMPTTEPRYLIGAVKAFVGRHAGLSVRVGEHVETVDVPEVKIANVWLDNYFQQAKEEPAATPVPVKTERSQAAGFPLTIQVRGRAMNLEVFGKGRKPALCMDIVKAKQDCHLAGVPAGYATVRAIGKPNFSRQFVMPDAAATLRVVHRRTLPWFILGGVALITGVPWLAAQDSSKDMETMGPILIPVIITGVASLVVGGVFSRKSVRVERQ